MGWGEFILATFVFFVSHSVPVRPRIRSGLVHILGPRGFTICYSLLSLGVLVWVIGAAGRAPHVILWSWAPWQNTVLLVAMGFACVLLAQSIGRPNPFSFGGSNNEAFDPANPGVIRFTRHPLLVSLGFWAFAHMVPNGNLSHVLLFGTLGSFAMLGQRIIDRRQQRQMGAEWIRLRAQVAASGSTGLRPMSGATMRRLGIAALVWGILVLIHPWLFGVSPIA